MIWLFFKKNLLLIVVLSIALLFRFYNLYNFQFWTSDEETAAIAVRKMLVEHRPLLIIPNSTLGTSLGPYFHYLSIPLYFVTNMNPAFVLGFMGFIGVLTTYIIFRIGKLAKNESLGLLAAFFYASSFVMGLIDRRWWPLSLNPLLCAVSVYSLLQIKNKRYIYSVPLAISIGFAIHADPSIAVIAFASVFAFLFLKIPILKRACILTSLTLLVFLAPLLIFELRHPGTIVKPYLVSFQNNYTGENLSPGKGLVHLISQASISFSNLTFAKQDKFAERYIASGFYINNSYFGTFLPIILFAILLYPVFKLKSKKLKNDEKNLLLILYAFMTAFLVLTLSYALFFKKDVYQHYFVIVFPIFFLLCAYTVLDLIRQKLLLMAIVITYFLTNLFALTTSSFKYPLKDKVQVIKYVSKYLSDTQFSLYSLGDEYFIGGGYTTLMILNGQHPKKSSDYSYYDWMYRAYSFYTIEPSLEDQDLIVIISKEPRTDFPSNKILSQKITGNIHTTVLDNKERWFQN